MCLLCKTARDMEFEQILRIFKAAFYYFLFQCMMDGCLTRVIIRNSYSLYLIIIQIHIKYVRHNNVNIISNRNSRIKFQRVFQPFYSIQCDAFRKNNSHMVAIVLSENCMEMDLFYILESINAIKLPQSLLFQCLFGSFFLKLNSWEYCKTQNVATSQ